MIQCGTSQFINIILYHYKPIIDRTFNLLARRPHWRSQGYTHIIHQLWPGSRNIKHAGSFNTLSYQGIATYTLTNRKQPFKSMEICFLQGPPNQNPPRRHPCNQNYLDLEVSRQLGRSRPPTWHWALFEKFCLTIVNVMGFPCGRPPHPIGSKKLVSRKEK